MVGRSVFVGRQERTTNLHEMLVRLGTDWCGVFQELKSSNSQHRELSAGKSVGGSTFARLGLSALVSYYDTPGVGLASQGVWIHP